MDIDPESFDNLREVFERLGGAMENAIDRSTDPNSDPAVQLGVAVSSLAGIVASLAASAGRDDVWSVRITRDWPALG